MPMTSPLALEPKTSALVVVDVQDRLARSMPPERLQALERSSRILIGAARELGAAVIYTEQYPKGLGPTLPALAAELEACSARRFEKLDFSACGADGFEAALGELGARSVVLLGMEAHVCVWLTARDLLARDYAVHVPIDGVVSRRDDHREVGLDLCRAAGATVTTSETVAFDWLKRAGGDSFKKVSQLIR
jgi:nicotinamidase-related amidase